MLDNLLTERGHDTRLHVIIETNAGLEADEPGGLVAEVDALVEALGDRHGLADAEADGPARPAPRGGARCS